MTTKDLERMETLVDYTREHGLTRGIEKAVRDADKIEDVEKAESRARILERQGCKALAVPFWNRVKYLRAAGGA